MSYSVTWASDDPPTLLREKARDADRIVAHLEREAERFRVIAAAIRADAERAPGGRLSPSPRDVGAAAKLGIPAGEIRALRGFV
jgi:hypothetical protein